MDDRSRPMRENLSTRVLLPALVVAGLVVIPPASSHADEVPAPPAAVRVEWTTLGPIPDEMQPAVRVSWQGSAPEASYAWHAEVWTGRTWALRSPMGSTAPGVFEDAEFAWRFPYRSTLRVAVHAVLGGVSSPDAYSPLFDTQGPRPLVREVRPHADGRVTVTWTPQLPGPDTTPGDPLDRATPFRYQIVQFAAKGEAFLDIGPTTTGLSGTVVPGTPGWLGVAPENEWTSGTGVGFVDFSQQVDYVDLSGTVLSSRIPSRTPYGRTLRARGTIRLVSGSCTHLECVRVVEPAPRRRVVLQARRGPAGPWIVVDRTTSGARGHYQLSSPSTGTREYRVLVRGVPWAGDKDRQAMAGATSVSVTGTTVTRVVSAGFRDRTVSRGQSCTAEVRVAPAFRQRAWLQRHTSVGWVDAGRTRLRHGRGFVELRPSGPGIARYRWVVSGTRVHGLPVRGIATRPFVLRTTT